MLLIILQVIFFIFQIYTLVQLYKDEKKTEENKTLKEENKSLKEENKSWRELHKRMVRIYIIDRQKMYRKQIEDLKEELEQLRQEKWTNI